MAAQMRRSPLAAKLLNCLLLTPLLLKKRTYAKPLEECIYVSLDVADAWIFNHYG
jgi:hypothetical protein